MRSTANRNWKVQGMALQEVYICPALVFELGGEKSPHLLVDLHLPGAGKSSQAYSLFSNAVFEVDSPLDTEEKKRFQKGGSGLSPANCARRTAERSACPAESRKLPQPLS